MDGEPFSAEGMSLVWQKGNLWFIAKNRVAFSGLIERILRAVVALTYNPIVTELVTHSMNRFVTKCKWTRAK